MKIGKPTRRKPDTGEFTFLITGYDLYIPFKLVSEHIDRLIKDDIWIKTTRIVFEISDTVGLKMYRL